MLAVDFLGGFLDETDDVAAIEDAAGDAARIERLKRVGTFAHAEELDRQTGDGAHRERRAAAAVAVRARQHEAGERQALMEALRGFDRVLTGEAVRDEQDFRGFAIFAIAAASLIICSSMVVRPAVSRISTSWPPRRAAESARLAISAGGCPATIGSTSTPMDLPSVESCSIAAGRRVSSDAISTRRLSVFVSAVREFRGRGGFAGALQARHHDHVRRFAFDAERLGRAVAAQHVHEPVVDDLHHLLAGLHRLHDRFADRLDAHLGDEVLHHRQRDVRLQERNAHFPQRRIDVGFRRAHRAR